MHIYGVKIDVDNTKMSGCSVDNRLRRQQPLNSNRSPRIKQGGRSLSLISGRQAQQVPKHQHTNSWHGGRSYYNTKNGDSVQDFKGIPVDASSPQFLDGLGSRQDWDNTNPPFHCSRPLIHHQRHNLKNRFQLLKTLGEGTYGKVKLAADCSTGEQVAIKYIKKTKIHDENDLVRIRREIQILSSLKHRHIVNIREVFEKKDKIVLVMDYAQGGELYDYLNRMGKLSEMDARRIFRQIVSAIHYCHQHGIVHRDLKLENIILDDLGNVKIADFGLANYYSHNDTLQTFCGSPLYASPEIVNGKPYHGPEVDAWSLGVVLYTLVYGAMPFESNSLISLKQQISQGDYDQPAKPSDAAGLIRHMLTVTPSRRATMDDALRHWWVNFGHAHMPNDAPYSPDDDPPVKTSSRILSADLDRSSTASSYSRHSTAMTTIIHQRNQSSISSDSDVELDFRPGCLAKISDTTVEDMNCNSSESPITDTSSSSSSCFSSSSASSTYAVTCTTSNDILAERKDSDLNPCQLPASVLDILNGHNNGSIASLLGTDKISTGFDFDDPLPGTVSGSGKERTPADKETDKNGATIFDSERKPKRGILKRRGKFSGGDSGCVMHEEMVAQTEEAPVPKSGHLPKRLPSFRGEAHGIFASRHRISQLLDDDNDTNNSNICAIPDSTPIVSANPSSQSHVYPHATSQTSHPNSTCTQHPCLLQQSNPQQPPPPEGQQQQQQQQENYSLLPEMQYRVPVSHSPHPDVSAYSCGHSSLNENNNVRECYTTIDAKVSSSSSSSPDQDVPQVSDNPSKCEATDNSFYRSLSQCQSQSQTQSRQFMSDANCNSIPSSSACEGNGADHSIRNTSCVQSNNSKNSNNANKETTTKVIRRPKGILKSSKTSQLNEARNRLSVSSIGSNSSADFLDLSYDSGDCDHYVNVSRSLASPDSGIRQSDSQHSSPPDSVDGGDRNSLYSDEDFQVLKMYSEENSTAAITTTTTTTTRTESVHFPSFDKNAFPGQLDVHGNPIFVESESPMLYRLTKEALELSLK